MNEPVWVEEVVLAQQGDAGAISALAQRFTPLARSTARRLVDDVDSIDDVVQEAFLDAFGTLVQLRVPTAFPAWLRLIVRKHAERFRRAHRSMETLEHHENVPTIGPGPDLLFEQQDTVTAVRAGLGALADPDRRLLELRYLADWTDPELADLLTISVGATRNTVILTSRPEDASKALRAGARLAAGLAAAGVDVILAVDLATCAETRTDAAALAALAGLSRGGGSVTAVLVDALARGAAFPDDVGLDTRLVFSVEQLALGIFPALDPIRSHVSFAEPAHAAEVRQLLARAAQVRAYFHQPMHVAATHTGEPGLWFDRAEAEVALGDLLALV